MKCVWFQTEDSTLSSSGTEYGIVQGSTGYPVDATETLRQAVICEDVTLTYVKFRLTTAPGSGNSRTITFRDDGSDTAATVTISDTATEGEWTGSVSVSSGSLISYGITSTGTPTASGAWGIETGYDTDGDYFLVPGKFVIGADTTNYINAWGAGTAASAGVTTATPQESIIASDATLLKNYVQTIGNANIVGALATSVRLNNSSDNLTATLTGATVTASATGTIDLAPNDLIVMKMVGSGGVDSGTSNLYTFCLKIQPDTVGEVLMGSGSTANPSTSAAAYDFSIGGVGGWNTNEVNRAGFFPEGLDIKKLYVKLAVAPNTGKSRTFCLRDNGADTALTLTISDAATTGNDTTHTVTYSGVGKGDIATTPSGTPDASSEVKLGYVIIVPQGGGGGPAAFTPRVMIY